MNQSNNKEQRPQYKCCSFLGSERSITVDEACALKMILFGQTSKSFNDGWTKQGFVFRSKPSYGLKQLNSGPCGLLAAVQTHVIFELLYGYSRTVLDFGFLKPDAAERKEALARSLASILWQAGDNKKAVVTQKNDNIKLDDSVTSDILVKDGLIEYITLKCFQSYDGLLQYLYNFGQLLMAEGGCILIMYSLLLTRGIDKIKQEMDDPNCHLIGNDGFCSQEIVNLILTGKASSNIFDGQLQFKSGGSVLRGISKKSKIGLLCLYDYQYTAAVGTNFKDPQYPIWVVYGELHFTVLFGTSRNILKSTSDPFKLFYYDGLAKKHAETSYIIKPDERVVEDEKDNSLPVVIRCILTRWPLAEIEVAEIENDSIDV